MSSVPQFLVWPRFAQDLARRPVVVLLGGASTEREVSLASGRAMLDALGTPGEGPTRRLTPPITPVEIDAAGQWCIAGRTLPPEAAVAVLPRDAVFLLALHGGAGEDGRIAAFLEVTGRTCSGTGHASAALCMHKGRTRLAAAEVGVRTAPGFCVPHGALGLSGSEARAGVLQRAAALPGTVRFAKHATGGSSVLVFRCTDGATLAKAVEEIAAAGGDLVVESGVVGLEVSCGLLGDGAAAQALPVVEILPRGASAFFDYGEKYSADGALERCPAELLDPDGEARVQAAARATWGAVGGEGYARIDFIVPGPESGTCTPGVEPVLLEVNTLPGFTPRSLLPRVAGAAGIDYRSLCFEVLGRALVRERGGAPTPSADG